MDNRLSTVETREAFFIALYKRAFPAVARYIARKGGSLEEAQDIFQDSLVLYYEKIASGKHGTVVNEKAYLMGVAKKLWLQHYKISGKSQSLGDMDIAASEVGQTTGNKLMHYLETAGQKCMELLKACYYDALPLTDVVSLFKYSGPHSATVAKYKCLEKVRETVKQQSLNYADFIE